jgi:hypothetical protein
MDNGEPRLTTSQIKLEPYTTLILELLVALGSNKLSASFTIIRWRLLLLFLSFLIRP